MDVLERMNDREGSYRYMLETLHAKIWTTLPGIVDAFNAEEATVDAHIAIKATLVSPDGTTIYKPYPPLYKLPIHFPAGGNTLCSFPIAKDDEILICFGARCIDNWWVRGDAQQPLETRLTDLSDGFCIPCVWSKPKAPPNLSTTTARLRSKDNSTYVELDATNQQVNVVAPGNVRVTAPTVLVQGDLHVTGAIIAGYQTGDQVGLQTHTHTQGPDSATNAQVPTNAPTPGT